MSQEEEDGEPKPGGDWVEVANLPCAGSSRHTDWRSTSGTHQGMASHVKHRNTSPARPPSGVFAGTHLRLTRLILFESKARLSHHPPCAIRLY